MHATHEVFNQPAPLANYNLFTGNLALQGALKFNAIIARATPIPSICNA